MAEPDVLIVDRDPRIRALIRLGLTREGYGVREAAAGDEALGALRHSTAKLVIAGLDVGTVDGIRLCEELRTAEMTRDIPVFLLARPDQDGVQARARTAGAVDLLVCPVFIKDLSTLSRLHVGRRADETIFGGDLGQLGLHYLLRFLTAGSRSGSLRLLQQGGTVTFSQGRIHAASFAGLTGEAALSRAVLIADGPFQIEYGSPDGDGAFVFTARDVVERLFPRVRRWQMLLGRLSPLSTVLAVDYSVLSKQVDTVPAPVHEMIRLFDARRDLKTVVLESSLDDLTALEVAVRLAELGILRHVPAPSGKGEAKSPALFEPEPKAAMAELRELFPGGTSEVQEMAEQAKSTTPEWDGDWAAELDALRLDYQRIETRDSTGGWSEVPVKNIALKEEAPAAPAVAAESPAAIASGAAPVAPQEAGVEGDFFQGRSVAEVEEELESVQASWGLVAALGVALVVVVTAALMLYLFLRRRAETPPPAPPSPVEVKVEPVAPPPPPGPTPEEKAKEEAEVAAQAKQEEAAVLIAEGKDLYTRGRAKEAVEDLQRAVDLAPEDTSARLLFALSLYDSGQPGKAEEQARLVLQADEKNARALLLLGTIAEDLGDKDTARHDYQRYLKIAPPGKEANEVKALLQNLK
jgi:CheY-like chemotaxis protein